MDIEDDYVWRFAVQAQTGTRRYDEPLVEMIRVFLDDFLSIGFLTSDGKRIRADGFAFTNNPECTYGIFPDKVTPGGNLDGKDLDAAQSYAAPRSNA